MAKVELSIIIVNYKVEKELFACLESIYKQKTDLKYEIIVVDNDEEKTLEERLLKGFSKVTYIASRKNVGYGGGNNLGVKSARGDYLFFLNPDTVLEKNALQELYKVLKSNKNIGIAAPLLLDKNKKPYKYQGTRELNLKNAFIVLSSINKFLPNNPVTKKFWVQEWDKKKQAVVEVVPGTAFMIKKDLFNKVGKFDKNYFLYFEEYDLCRRVKSMGKKIVIEPKSRVLHYWGRSTVKNVKSNEHYYHSRDYYFTKHFGRIKALLLLKLPLFLLSKNGLLFLLVLGLGTFLRFYKIGDGLFPFIGDQAWFFLSARDMLLSGNIPLVGITSSHTWLSQGPFWTYILAFVFGFFGFNPVIGAYVSALIGVVTIAAVYFFVHKLFGVRIALVSMLFFAASPQIVMGSRMPYHTSPIPLFLILFFHFLYKGYSGSKKALLLSFLFLGILYNFQLSTQVLWGLIIAVFALLFIQRRKYFYSVVRIKVLITALLLFFLPLIPILLYDLQNGFKQTAGFAFWAVSKPFLTLTGHGGPSDSTDIFYTFLIEHARRLIFDPIPLIALIILGLLFLNLLILLKNSDEKDKTIFVLLSILVPLAGLFLIGSASEAYLPLLYPQLVLGAGLLFGRRRSIRFAGNISLGLVVLIALLNAFSLLNKSFYVDRENGYGFSLKSQQKAVNHLSQFIDKQEVRIEVYWGEGQSPPESASMGYEYLGWYSGMHIDDQAKVKALFASSVNGIGVYLQEESGEKELLFTEKINYVRGEK